MSTFSSMYTTHHFTEKKKKSLLLAYKFYTHVVDFLKLVVKYQLLTLFVIEEV